MVLLSFLSGPTVSGLPRPALVRDPEEAGLTADTGERAGQSPKRITVQATESVAAKMSILYLQSHLQLLATL